MAVPGDAPVTLPVVETTGATDELLLPHAPPAVVLLSTADRPWQTAEVPVMAPGSEFTVMVLVTKQPDGNV